METVEFIYNLTWGEIPAEVQMQARRCLLDTFGAAIAGRGTELSRIIHDFSATAFQGSGAKLWQDGRQVSPPGAALANAMTIDSFDIHDGHKLVKGHAGAAVVPAALATISLDKKGVVSGQEFLATLVMGYEIALRAGIALHATACDFHTSGAWNTLGAAAVTSRRLGLQAEQTRHALGIAEYHGPRSPMMRDIDFPTMVKDGSGWGAMAGVSAGMMAASGFTGAPALTVEGKEVTELWSDLGERWRILEVYFKPYAVCYWAQPAVVGALAVQKKYQLNPQSIRKIRVFTFHQATRLAIRRPANTEEAQYSLAYPVAAALVHGRLGSAELIGENLRDPLTLRLAEAVEPVEDPALSAQFPAQRFARVQIETVDGKLYEIGETTARWEPSQPPTDEELLEKFRWLAGANLSEPATAEIEGGLWNCASLPDIQALIENL